jgi:putative redox protein
VLTVRLYAERKQWPLDRIEAQLVREPPQGNIATITLDLMLGGPLDDEQRQRLHAVAARCPVHRTLTETVRIVRA